MQVATNKILTFTRLLYICIDKDFRTPIVWKPGVNDYFVPFWGNSQKGLRRG